MNLRSNKERAKNTIGVLYFMVILMIISIVVYFLQFKLLKQEIITAQDIQMNKRRIDFVNGEYLFGKILAAFIFIQWFRRSYFNLHQTPIAVNYSEGWAAGAWFVPFLNLFRPYQIMKEIWYKTQSSVKIENPISHNSVKIWWGVFIIGNIVNFISISYPVVNNESLMTATLIGIVGNIVSIIAAFLAINVVKKVSNFEEQLFFGKNEMNIEDHLID